MKRGSWNRTAQKYGNKRKGGMIMRVWRGKTLAEKHQATQDKKRAGKKAAPLTADQRKKIKELQKRIEDENRARLNSVPNGAEIRG